MIDDIDISTRILITSSVENRSYPMDGPLSIFLFISRLAVALQGLPLSLQFEVSLSGDPRDWTWDFLHMKQVLSHRWAPSSCSSRTGYCVLHKKLESQQGYTLSLFCSTTLGAHFLKKNHNSHNIVLRKLVYETRVKYAFEQFSFLFKGTVKWGI